MNNFPHLFEPIEIGKTTVKNRIFMPPISTNMADKGYVTDAELNVSKTDSLGKNLLNAYLIGSHIHSNLIDTDYMTPYTAKNKKQNIKRT